jgi:septum formation protein
MSAPVGRPSLLLASASPRRRRLLAWLGVPYDVTSVDTPEDLTGPLKSLPPVLVRSIAAEKASAARKAAAASQGDAIDGGPTILGFDTIVLVDRRILGKPADLDGAWEMLRTLSGRTHEVVTGVAILRPEAVEPRTFAVTTVVRMRALTDDDIQAWADEGELLGCAGAYNIERHLASVDDGECFHNVAGTPLCHVYRELTRSGIEGLTSPAAACDAAWCTTCSLGARVGRPAPRRLGPHATA